MKLFFVTLMILQIFLQQGRSATIDHSPINDNKEHATAVITKCMETTAVNVDDLKTAVDNDDLGNKAVAKFSTCYEEAMGPSEESLGKYCQQTVGEGQLMPLLKCYHDIILNYLKEFLA
ncbi:hypothetical protein PPYR_12825 [Photinus pyralis]|uniref:Uncharacterized protein n=1 Tax=Photinus pyralis TaxID=7054 RepID=A0A1Y1NDU7_PHOPY|nr:uncharacterized protein LOC116179071 [Photinus pyralis]KAB0793205.1 hypothetical protein PPYR_12825 [Photinus pyralis]